MRISVHAVHVEDALVLDTAADVAQSGLHPVPERRWVADSGERGGHMEATGNVLTDEYGQPLYSVPVRAARPDGTPVSGVYVRVRGLSDILPARTPLRPTGTVVVTMSTAGRGSVTITCDSLEPISTVPRHVGEVTANADVA